MSKRNLILLIITLVVITAIIFGFLYFYKPAKQTGNTTKDTNFLTNFLPFGNNTKTEPTKTTPPTNISGFKPTTGIDTINLKLKKVSSFPIAGFGVFMKERFKETPIVGSEQIGQQIKSPPKITKTTLPSTEFMPALRYVNRATGNIYQTFADRIDQRKFSSTIVPRVYEAFFGNKGESVIMRYLKENTKIIETFIGALQKEYLGADSIGINKVKGSFLPENISDISVSSDSSTIFYLFNIGENAIGVTYSLKNNTKVQVFDSPFTEWLSFWPKNNLITVTTKPSANVPGFMYVIDPNKKDFNRILSNINGLTTLTSPDGKIVLYGDNNLSLNIFNINTGNSSLLGIKTLPEKCVWGKASDVVYCAVPRFIDRAQYPDSWYQGEISFSDKIWKIDVISGNTTMVSDPISISGEEVDGIKLKLDENQNYLFFVNKKDSYLWELKLR